MDVALLESSYLRARSSPRPGAGLLFAELQISLLDFAFGAVRQVRHHLPEESSVVIPLPPTQRRLPPAGPQAELPAPVEDEEEDFGEKESTAEEEIDEEEEEALTEELHNRELEGGDTIPPPMPEPGSGGCCALTVTGNHCRRRATFNRNGATHCWTHSPGRSSGIPSRMPSMLALVAGSHMHVDQRMERERCFAKEEVVIAWWTTWKGITLPPTMTQNVPSPV